MGARGKDPYPPECLRSLMKGNERHGGIGGGDPLPPPVWLICFVIFNDRIEFNSTSESPTPTPPTRR
jgi:hypothetical protein